LDTPAEVISKDTPLRLEAAVKAAFPAGGMTVRGLRGEIAKGRLEVELIAGKLFTTLAAIARMRELCRVAPKNLPSHEALADQREARSDSNLLAQRRLEALIKCTVEKLPKRRRR
jgi:hypothetical protein